jgi:hypothetical protein
MTIGQIRAIDPRAPDRHIPRRGVVHVAPLRPDHVHGRLASQAPGIQIPVQIGTQVLVIAPQVIAAVEVEHEIGRHRSLDEAGSGSERDAPVGLEQQVPSLPPDRVGIAARPIGLP